MKQKKNDSGRCGAQKELALVFAKAGAGEVVRAARQARDNAALDLVPSMETAFQRFMRNGVKADPGCFAKLALVDALQELGSQNETILLQGLQYTQPEPVWTPPFSVDTAADLRGNCAMVLAGLGYPGIWREAVTLCADPEVQARRAAIRLLGHLGGEKGELLLRAKILSGDDELDVIALALDELMKVAPDECFEFVAAHLQDNRLPVAEGAALALVESHHAAAFQRLLNAWEENVDSEYRNMLLLPMALMRHAEAFEFLVTLIRDAPLERARDVVSALRLYRSDADKTRQIRDAVDRRGDRALARRFNDEFGTDG